MGDFERLAFKGWNEVQCIHFYKNARPRFAFSGCITQKSPKVCYVRRKNGCKNQADRNVRQADSGGRLDRYVRTNKAFEGVGVPRGRGRIASPRFTLTLSNILPWQNILRWHRLCSLSFCVSPWPHLVPFRRCGKEHKKETKIYKNIRLSQILIWNKTSL